VIALIINGRASLDTRPCDGVSTYFNVCDFANISTHREVNVTANIVEDETRASWKRASWIKIC
jgi:hypothetical protein